MDADERLTALKKAYADIILNTAKEAAARILLSERKAFRYQHELNVTKTQGLQMLLRLKQLSDSNASEAELMSLNQQRKIEVLESQLMEAEDRIKKAELISMNQQKEVEELEAQLHEAEDIVKDLRDELKELETELERIKNRKLKKLNEHDCYVNDTSKVNGTNDDPQSTRISSIEPADQLNQYFQNEYHAKPNLQHKVCTSNILSPLAEPPLETSFATSADLNPSSNLRNHVFQHFHKNASLPNIILKCKDPELFRHQRIQRIRAFEEKLMSGQLGYNDPANCISEDLISLGKDKEGEGVCRTAIRKTNNNGSGKKKGVSSVKFTTCNKQRRDVKHRKTKTSSSIAGNNPNNTEANCDDNNDLQFGDGPMNVVVPLMSPTTAETRNDKEVIKTSNSEKTSNNDEVENQNLMPLKEVNGLLTDNCLQVSPCVIDPKEANIPFEKSLETASFDPTFANRIIKYTFQRKRKRDSTCSCTDGIASLEMKKSDIEKQNDPVEMQMSGKTTESTGDRSNIEQAPCQLLISLSDKKMVAVS